jgi:hypothetical protein
MKKTLFLIAAVALGMSSCKKEDTGSDNMVSFAARYGQTVILPTTNFTVEEAETMVRSDENSAYTDGILVYKTVGEERARLTFEGDVYPEVVVRNAGAEEERTQLTEDCLGEDGKKDYHKVIVEPLVYAEDCGYVVSGVIKFFDCNKSTWLATFDYGDGTCDDLIAKTTDDYDNYMFSMNDYPEWNK